MSQPSCHCLCTWLPKKTVAPNCLITNVLKWRNNVDCCVKKIKYPWAARPGVNAALWAHFALLLLLHHRSCGSHSRSRSNNWSSLCRCSFECEVFGTSLVVHTHMGGINCPAARSCAWFTVTSHNIICQMANLGLYVLPNWRCHILIIAYCTCTARRGCGRCYVIQCLTISCQHWLPHYPSAHLPAASSLPISRDSRCHSKCIGEGWKVN